MGGSRRKSEEGSRARGGGTDRTDGTRKGSYGREGMSSTSGGVVAKRRRGGLKGRVRVRDAKPPKADRAGMKARSGHCNELDTARGSQDATGGLRDPVSECFRLREAPRSASSAGAAGRSLGGRGWPSNA